MAYLSAGKSQENWVEVNNEDEAKSELKDEEEEKRNRKNQK